MSFLWSILLGALSGYLAGLFMRGGGLGFWWNLVLGVLGGVIGNAVFSFFGMRFGGDLGYVFTAVIGALILLYIANKISRIKK